jgi:hypothetical protein
MTALTAASLLVGIAAVLCAGIWRCAALLFRIAVAVERVPEIAATVQQLDHRTTRIEAEMGIT